MAKEGEPRLGEGMDAVPLSTRSEIKVEEIQLAVRLLSRISHCWLSCPKEDGRRLRHIIVEIHEIDERGKLQRPEE
jgi:hypothetical protein